jgi:tight adherence protein B
VTHRVVLLILSFLICSFLGTFFVLLAQRLWGRRQARMEQRLGLGPAPRRETTLQISPEFDETTGLIGRVNRGFGRFFAQTGIEMSSDAAFLVAAALGLMLAGSVLLWRDDMLEAAGALGLGFLSVIGYYRYRRAKRLAEIREQLPDVMELLARAVRAGESLDQAVQLVGTTVAKPLGPEFSRLARQLEMGLSIDAAMRAMSRRAPVTEIRILASTLMVQRETGGSLSVTLERLSAVIRDRLSYHRQFKAATGAGRFSTLLIGIAGPLIAAYLFVFQREYFNKFTESYPGQMLLGTAILLQVIGFLWIYRLLKSDY